MYKWQRPIWFTNDYEGFAIHFRWPIIWMVQLEGVLMTEQDVSSWVAYPSTYKPMLVGSKEAFEAAMGKPGF
jgi:hypothetical protein